MRDTKTPIAYMQRTRDYYLALGYGAPYEWASFADVPFKPLSKPLADSTIGLITTAAPYQSGKGNQGPGAPYNAGAKFYEVYAAPSADTPDLRISHIAIDRDHTTAEDLGSYFPLVALKRAVTTGMIGKLSDQFFGLPTNRSKRTTISVDGPALLAHCRKNAVDAAVLVPNCPVCHQSVSIAARILEEAGIATVIMGCAKDIVEHVGVPRFLFSDFPLGNAAGRPNDPASQTDTLALALKMLETVDQPRSTYQSMLEWIGPPDWKEDYSNAAKLSPDEIARRKRAFDEGKAAAKQVLNG